MSAILTWVGTLTLSAILPNMIIAVLGIMAIKAMMKMLDATLHKSKLEPAAIGLVTSLAKVVLFLLLGMIIADRLGIDVTGIVALASVASLALSLAFQGILSNVIGGFTILSQHSFKSGDYVEVAGLSGTVETIDIAYTKLKTPDNKVISIPNSSVVASQIVNYSTETTRRVDIAVTASYDAPIAKVKEALLKAADIPATMKDPAPFAGLTKYGDNSIEYILRIWCANADYWDVMFTVNERIKSEFDNANIEMTYPHLNVHLDK